MVIVVQDFRTLEEGLPSLISRPKASFLQDRKVTVPRSHEQYGLQQKIGWRIGEIYILRREGSSIQNWIVRMNKVEVRSEELIADIGGRDRERALLLQEGG